LKSGKPVASRKFARGAMADQPVVVNGGGEAERGVGGEIVEGVRAAPKATWMVDPWVYSRADPRADQ
jgi:hypothetical protein